jgi:hypothetical protein
MDNYEPSDRVKAHIAKVQEIIEKQFGGVRA